MHNEQSENSVLTSAKEKERAILNGLLLGVASLIIGTIAAIMGNSVVLVVGTLRAASETFASFLSYMSIRQVNKGKSSSYNYGYGKLENISGLIVAGAMLISFLVVMYVAILRFRDPQPVGQVWLGVLQTSATLIFNLQLWRRYYQLSKQSYSPIMEAQWQLFRAKSLANIGVIVALLLSSFLRSYSWAAYIDPVASLIFAGMLLITAYSVAKDSIFDLLDQALDEVSQVKIMQTVQQSIDRYHILHGIRSRKSGMDVYIELFLEFSATQTMHKVQESIDLIQHDLEQLIPNSHVSIVPTTSAAYALLLEGDA